MGQPLKCLFQSDLQKCPVENSTLVKGYLSSQIQRAVDRQVLTGHEIFVHNIASGWAAQLGYINAMVASFFSTISVWSASRSFVGVVLTLTLLLLMFIPMLWYLFAYEPDQIESDKSGRIPYTPAFVCKAVLLLVNVSLLVAIAASQQLS